MIGSASLRLVVVVGQQMVVEEALLVQSLVEPVVGALQGEA